VSHLAGIWVGCRSQIKSRWVGVYCKYISLLKHFHLDFWASDKHQLLCLLWLLSYEEVCRNLAPAAPIFFYKIVIFYCITLCTHISFRSKYEYQICEYYQKEQLLEDKVMLIETQYKKNPLVILTIKKHNHLQYISYGNIW